MEREQGMSTESHGMKSTSGTSLWVHAKRRGAEVLRTCAGVAAGWRGERRGTFLVLVVGVLALLSVIAIVYSAIGVGDRTRSFAVVKADRVNQVPDEVRDWIAAIIAGDVLDTHYDVVPGTGLPRLRREATDYPWTEWNVVSSISVYNRNQNMLFTNSGGFDPSRPRTEWAVQWLPGDPWLASTSPTWIRGGANATRHGVLAPGDNLADHERDWLHISNIAPDGRYVNLFNLRGNFEASPGITNGQMSFGLTLLNHNANSVAGAVVDPPSTDFGVAVVGNLYDHPAYWSNRQVGLFRPVTSVCATPVGATPSRGTYFNYQYADADGDGFYDSRWQELVNASDPNNVFSVITKDPKYRWFVAARIVDLSSLVNVNTATDLITPPSAEAPIGTSPSEVDLWRLLTQVDVRDAYGYTLDAAGVPQALTGPQGRYGYDALPGRARNPGELGTDAGYYDNYLPATLGVPVGGHAYRALRVGVASGLVPPLAVTNNVNATPIAGSTIAPWGDAVGTGATYAEDLGLNAPAKVSLWKFDRYELAPGGWRTSHANDGAYARRSYYERRVADILGAGRNVDNAGTVQNSYSSALVFGMPDLAELLTRRGINDPEVRTPLEMAMGGRTNVPTVNPSLLRYSPMRENRSLAFELAWDVLPGGYSDGLIDPLAYRGRAADIRQYLTTISGARPLASMENVDLTRLDARELKIDLIKELYTIGTATYTPNLLSWQVRQHRPENVRLEATRKIFRMYADALLGESARAGAWDVGGAGASLRTLFYGYGGPEKAAYFAAFSAINMQAMALPGSPEASGPYTLIVGEDGRGTLQNGGPGVFPEAYGYNPQTGQVYLNASTTNTEGAIGGRRLDMNAGNINATTGRTTRDAELGATGTRLAPSGVNTLTPGGVATVYPAEAQPFITAVSCFTAYADAPLQTTAPGGSNTGADAEFQNGPPQDQGNITIRPAMREENQDFLFRVLAFQLHNPSATDVYLSSPDEIPAQPGQVTPLYNMQYLDIGHANYPPMNTQESYHYIKYGGRTFKLIGLSEGTTAGPEYVSPLERGRQVAEMSRYFDDVTAGVRRAVVPGAQSKPAMLYSGDPSGLGIALAGNGMMPIGASGRGTNLGIGVNAFRIHVPAGKTVVCYALSQPPQAIIERLRRIEHSGLDVNTQRLSDAERRLSSTLRRAIYRAIGEAYDMGVTPNGANNHTTDISGVYWVPEIDPTTGYPGALNEDPNTGGTAGFRRYNDRASAGGGWEAFGQLMREHVRGAATPEDNKVAYLYRTRRFGTNAIAQADSRVPNVDWDEATAFGTGTLALYPANDEGDDQLLDRFRMPNVGGAVADLDSRIRMPVGSPANATVTISGTQADRLYQSPPSSGPGEDDTGYTVMLWAFATRPTDPNGSTATGSDKVPTGAIPGFCIEPKAIGNWNDYATWLDVPGSTAVTNAFDGLQAGRGELRGRLETNGSFGEYPKDWLKNLRNRAVNSNLADLNLDTLVRSATKRDGAQRSIDTKPMPITVMGQRPGYAKTYPVLSALGSSLPPVGVQDAPTNAPAAHVDRGRIERNLKKLRVTDALLPLAVGAIRVPGAPTLNEQWFTLGEMLAMTMGYDSTPPGTMAELFAPEPADVMLYPTDTPPRPLSNGNLVLDAYSPFEMGGGGRPNPVYFGDNAGDRRAGLQIPLALGVLDRLTTAGVGSLTEMVPGVVNANTMPQMVARTIPMLAPNVAKASPLDTAGAINGGFKPKGAPSGTDALYWWGQNTDIPQAPVAGNNYTTDLPAEIDVTAALISYRDKGSAYLGLQRVFQYNARGPTVTLPASVRVVDGPSVDAALSGANSRVGRSLTTLIDGISEQPGFKSLGEIMCARKRDSEVSPGTIVPTSYGAPFNIDFGGFDVITPGNRDSNNINNSFVGVDGSMTYAEGETAPAAISGRASVRPNGATENVTIPAGATTSNSFNAKPNVIGNEQGEKLMIAAGAMGSLSVRSDVYAVWFVLHGYQRTDCEGLGASDPLTPSIARRFMMVVDRSNVVKKGDTPKVLMFKEVPLN